MPTYVITAPDGTELEVTAPEGASQAQVLAYAKANYKKQPAKEEAKTTETPKAKQEEDSGFFAGLRRAGLLPELGSKQTKEEGLTRIADLLHKTITAPAGGFVKAAMDIPVGLVQLAVNTLGSDASKDEINKWVKEYDKFGDTSEVTRFVGSMALPLGKALEAKTALGAVGKSAAVGGAVAAATPTMTDTENYWGDKAFQAGVGAIIGGAIPAVALGLGKVGKIIEDINLSKDAKQNAIRDYLNNLAGPEKEQVVNKLRNAGELVSGSKPTAAQALSDMPSAASLVAEQGRVGRTPAFAVREAEQAAARQQALGTIAQPRGITQEQMLAAREAATAPSREAALAQANIYGEVAPGLEADIAARGQGAVQALQVQGKTATEAAQAGVRFGEGKPGWLSNADRAVEFKNAAIDSGNIVDQRKAEKAFKELQLKSLKDEGFFPLESAPVIDKLESLANTKGIRAKDGVPEALREVSQKLRDLSSENGVIDSADLYAVRQELGNTIRSSLAGRNVTPNEKVLAGLSSSVQNTIDEAIKKASGSTVWDNYLQNYTKYSQRLDRMKVGQALVDKLGGSGKFDVEQAGAFASAVDKSAPLIKEATKTTAEKTLKDVLTPREMSTVASVVADLKRAKQAALLTSKVEKPTGELGKAVPDIKLLDRRATIAESLFRYIKQGDQKKMDLFISDLMLNPQKLADFLEAVPKGKMDTFIRGMVNTSSPEVATALVQRFGVAAGQEARRD